MALIANPDGQTSLSKTLALLGGFGGVAMAIAGGVLLATGNPAGAALIKGGLALAATTGGLRQWSNANRAKALNVGNPSPPVEMPTPKDEASNA